MEAGICLSNFHTLIGAICYLLLVSRKIYRNHVIKKCILMLLKIFQKQVEFREPCVGCGVVGFQPYHLTVRFDGLCVLALTKLLLGIGQIGERPPRGHRCRLQVARHQPGRLLLIEDDGDNRHKNQHPEEAPLAAPAFGSVRSVKIHIAIIAWLILGSTSAIALNASIKGSCSGPVRYGIKNVGVDRSP